MILQDNFGQLKQEVLQQYWGYSQFRDLQEEIINSIIYGHDTVCLLPTGGGKSLCYQLPAVITEGLCIVISPLLALMKEQVHTLKKRGIEAEYLSSDIEETEEDSIYIRCKEGLTKLLYISPERLLNKKFLYNYPEMQISFIAVDEAHCISEWGQDFRPSYQNIRVFREQFVNIPCMALTATATPKVLDEICEKLNLKHPKIFRKGFARNNIRINMIEISDKYEKIYQYLKINHQSGIIYTNRRKEAESLAYFLKSKGIGNVDDYHAGMSVSDKRKKQAWWQSSDRNVLISTNAFGMGIDKANVHFVIHFNPPGSIENYYQEIGRAGRDGETSYAFLLWNEQDLLHTDDILKRQLPSQKEYDKIILYLYSLFQIADHEFFESEVAFRTDRLEKLTGCNISKIKAVLEFLNHQEIIYLRKNAAPSAVELKIPYTEFESLAPADAYFLELLQRNLVGLTSGKTRFNERSAAEKMGTQPTFLKSRLKEMQAKGYLDYIDGSLSSIRFLKPRNDLMLRNQYWKLFRKIQENKIRKWNEMKYFIKENSYCKMNLILHYFGEKPDESCHHCSVCEAKEKKTSSRDGFSRILEALQKRPATLDEICIMTQNHQKEEVLEKLILLLDSGKIKMLNYQTYTLA